MSEIYLPIQLAIGIVFLISGVAKINDHKTFRNGVEAYNVLPPRVAPIVADIIIVVEAGLAISHLTGLGLRLALPLGIGTLLLFALAISTNLTRRNAIPCHCFGGSEVISWNTLVRVACLTGGEVVLFTAARTNQIPMPASEFALATIWAVFILLGAAYAFSLGDLVALFKRD